MRMGICRSWIISVSSGVDLLFVVMKFLMICAYKTLLYHGLDVIVELGYNMTINKGGMFYVCVTGNDKTISRFKKSL